MEPNPLDTQLDVIRLAFVELGNAISAMLEDQYRVVARALRITSA